MQEIMHVTVMISIIQYFGGGQNTYYAANKNLIQSGLAIIN